MELNRQALELMDDDDIAMWGEYADQIAQSDAEFAEEIYQKILGIDPEHTTALSNYADFLQEQNRHREVKLIYSRLLQLENDNPNLYFRVGAFSVDTGDFDAAEKHFIRFLEKEPFAAERLMDKANELAEKEKFRSAEWYYRFMMKQIPDDPFIFNNYALLMADLGRFAEAEEYFKKCLSNDFDELATDISVEFNYANLLFLLDRIEEAEWYYHKALAKDPKDVPVLNNYVSLLIRNGEFREAEETLKKILVITPADITALQNYSNLLVRSGRFEEAIHVAQMYVNSYPQYAPAYFQLASILAEASHLEDSVKMLEKSLELDPDYMEATTLLAVTLSDLEEFDKSEEIFKKALMSKGGDPLLRFYYAAMLFDAGRYEDSKKWADALIETDANHGEAWSLLGSIANAEGKIYEARSLFEKAVEKDPYNPEVWLQIALFYHQIRDYLESDQAFKKALELSPDDFRIINEKNRCEEERQK
ncbi:MAG: tetratricopeptide repeat protein [Brevinema sp.]